ncbi:Velvet complex subunit 2 [Podosphaera aphanis]|nr:Velvet complex subunit 2 [Podosphaera aphanis]
MITTYEQQAPSLCHRESRPDAIFESSSAYPSTAPMGLPQQSHIPSSYAGPFIPLASSRSLLSDSMHNGEAIASGPSGGQSQASEPMPTSCTHKGKKYQLLVVQQPQRARMCGFGDKDRRPITPPPCVKLIVTDLDTGKESDFNTIEHGMFVLNVDLWSADGKSEVNLVRQTANSPSLPSTMSGSYSDGNANSYHLPNSVKPESGQAPYNSHYSSNDSAQAFGQQTPQTYPSPNSYSQPATPQQMYFNIPPIHPASPQPRSYQDSAQGQLPPFSNRSIPTQDPSNRLPLASLPLTSLTSQPQGMFTRNLIGSLAASAFRLTDPDDKIGIWFVLQDLSVRTEGDFRLRFSFVNLSEIALPPAILSGNGSGPVKRCKSPVLARCFSDVFSVYSAKRFPGVVESTPLSRCFATQGIKIPIRKDAAKGDKDKDDDDD